MKPATITCQSCDWSGPETEAKELPSFVDWACNQDPRHIAMLPVGECPSCRAPVYYPEAQAEMRAASAAGALLAALVALSDMAVNVVPPALVQGPELRAAEAAIAQARAASIEPTS